MLAAVLFLFYTLGAVVFLFVAGHFAIGVVRAAMVQIRGVTPDARADLEIYRSIRTHMPRYWLEHRTIDEARFEYEPFTGWRGRPFDGQEITVEANGLRRTVKSSAPGATTVFLFGGSAMWGYGAPDAYTIPSQVQALLGPRYDVYNYGERGYIVAQELNRLLALVSAGTVPAVAVFYDGSNDVYGGVYSPAIPRTPYSAAREWSVWQKLWSARHRSWLLLGEAFWDSNYKYVLHKVAPRLGQPDYDAWFRKIGPDIARNVEGTLDRYEQNVRQINALAREYGFKAYVFWQPNLLSGSRVPVGAEKALMTREAEYVARAYRPAYEAARRRLGGGRFDNVYLLDRVFDGIGHEIYLDWTHVGPEGNAIIAARIADVIRRGRAP